MYGREEQPDAWSTRHILQVACLTKAINPHIFLYLCIINIFPVLHILKATPESCCKGLPKYTLYLKVIKKEALKPLKIIARPFRKRKQQTLIQKLGTKLACVGPSAGSCPTPVLCVCVSAFVCVCVHYTVYHTRMSIVRTTNPAPRNIYWPTSQLNQPSRHFLCASTLWTPQRAPFLRV